MFRRAQQSRILASLLALAVFVSQTSVVFAAFEMFPVNSEETHCMMSAKAADTKLVEHQLSNPMDCCETSECAGNICVPGFSSSTVLTGSVILLHNSVYAQTTLDNSDLLQIGVDSSSPYRPPRHHA